MLHTIEGNRDIMTGPDGSQERTPTLLRDVYKRIIPWSLALLSIYVTLYIFTGYDVRIPFTQRDFIMLFVVLLDRAFPLSVCMFLIVFGFSRFIAGRYFRERINKSSLIIVVVLSALLGFAFGVSDYYSADGDSAIMAIRHGIKFSLGFVFILAPATILLNLPMWINKRTSNVETDL
jgi:hypothetical protein